MGSTVLDAGDIELPDDGLISIKEDSGLKGLEVVDDEKGIVQAFVSVTGVLDRVGDIIEPGAYEKTLAVRTPKGLVGHDWKMTAGKVLEVKELLPGDPGLPATLSDGSPWPAGAGALYVKSQYNLATQRGRDAYEDAKFYGDQQEWSIGYSVPKTKEASFKDAKGVRHIKTLDLFEYSQVLWGAMPHARTSSIKSEDIELEIKGDGARKLKEPVTMPDGSFPIQDRESLNSAIHLWGHSKHPEKAKAHIKRVAAMLGCTDALPDKWDEDKDSNTSDLENKDEQSTTQEDNAPMDLKDVLNAWKVLGAFLHEQKQIDDELYSKVAGLEDIEGKTMDSAEDVIEVLGTDLFDAAGMKAAERLAVVYDFALESKNEETILVAQKNFAEFLHTQSENGVDVKDVAVALLSLYDDGSDDGGSDDQDGHKDDQDDQQEVKTAEVIQISREEMMAMLGR